MKGLFNIISARRGLVPVVAALAVAAPASAHDETSVGGERKGTATSFSAPVPSVALPSFHLEFDGTVVDSEDLLPSTVDGGTLILKISGASTSPRAEVAQHCADGEAGASIRVQRVSPGASVEAWFDPGSPTDGLAPYRLGGHSISEGDKNTSVGTSLCQGL